MTGYRTLPDGSKYEPPRHDPPNPVMGVIVALVVMAAFWGAVGFVGGLVVGWAL